ncbi:hypothetical protein D3C83_66220 [compost metagenome]
MQTHSTATTSPAAVTRSMSARQSGNAVVNWSRPAMTALPPSWRASEGMLHHSQWSAIANAAPL